jgi:predicted MFS family arabinose efflux permease
VIAANTGAGTSEAATAAAGFLFGMLLARGSLAAGFGTRAPRPRVITVALLAVVVGSLITWRAGSPVLGSVGLFVAGLGVGPLYPVTIAFALSLVPNNAEAGASRATLATGVAVGGAPFLLAVAAEQIGLVNAWPMIAAIAVVSMGMALATRRDAAPRGISISSGTVAGAAPPG